MNASFDGGLFAARSRQAARPFPLRRSGVDRSRLRDACAWTAARISIQLSRSRRAARRAGVVGSEDLASADSALAAAAARAIARASAARRVADRGGGRCG